MTLALEGAQTTMIPILPDRTVYWERTETSCGTLYTAPSCPSEVARKVLQMSVPSSDVFRSGSKLGKGAYGEVIEDTGIAYKRALHTAESDVAFGLPGLKAMMAVSKGIENLGRIGKNILLNGSGATYEAVAPSYFAGLDPYEKGTDRRDYLQAIAMSYEAGRRPLHDEELPDRPSRNDICVQAVKSVGLNPAVVHYDTKESNLLIRDGVDGAQQLVLLDPMAAENCAEFYVW